MKDNKEEIKQFVENTASYAQNKGVDLIIVRGVNDVQNQIRFSQNKIDINKQWLSNKLEVVLAVNGNQVVTNEFSPINQESINTEIENTIKFANKIDPSPRFLGVEEGEKTTKVYPAVEDVFDSRIDEFTTESPELVNSTINAAIDAGARRVAGSLLFGKKYSYLVNSLGPKGLESNTTYYNLTVRAFQDSLDESGQGLWCGRKKINEKLINAGKTAGEFSKAHKNCKQGKPGIYDVILTPAVGANLLGGLVKRANPLFMMFGLSPFEDRLGEQIAPEFVHVNDNALIEGGLNTSSFDMEGTPHKITEMVKDGVLVDFIHNTSTARRYQTETTGNSGLYKFYIGSKILAPITTNLVFNNGTHTFNELLEGSRPTIFITCNWYTRFTNYISTEFSSIPRDAMFLVENGELGQPIKNVRISDNLLGMMKNIEAMGNDRVQVKWWEVISPTFIPTIKIKDCRITTATI
ncbi:MAG: TldD/PmbA family protein [Candidatus Hodarchaeales archaeon]